MVRYALGSNSYFLWGDEGTPYTKAAAIAKNFGLLSQDITPPRPNKKTALPSIGTTRRPYVYAADPNEYAFDIPFEVQHADAPFHAALGAKAVTTVPETILGAGDGYTKTRFTEASILPTITVQHGSRDLGILQDFVGTKASLGLMCAKGEGLRATLGVVSASEEHDTTSPAFQSVTLPTNEPFRFSHIESVKMLQPGTQTLIKSIETMDSMDYNWNPGLEAVPHGGSGRENYSVVEGDPANLYDMKIGVTATDADTFTRAADDTGVFDLEILFARTLVGAVPTDAFIARLFRCTLLDNPVPAPSSGRIRADLMLGPTSAEIEMHTPL